eukprot:gnl/MRDRNA2_/MRDRNA2_35530_c0_seq1.p1 gnl/MRDRNA2_/MRDRNA2_35530_c0~~gnl/MRDRNA2_/MRDRNA2_35530_c0_seq1.p1  ORF type:complete len:238 (+),score=42.86 gnl/MRDRNA2_/MRDRNA2_35530_c0_seq1:105-818(+)
MGATCAPICACCQPSSDYTLGALRSAIVGKKNIVRKNPHIYVTVTELILKKHGVVTFSPHDFWLTGLNFVFEVQIAGSVDEILYSMYSDAFGDAIGNIQYNMNELMVKAGLRKNNPSQSSDLMEDVLEKEERLLKKSERPELEDDDFEEHVFHVSCTVDMWRDKGDPDINVHISDMDCDVKNGAVDFMCHNDKMSALLEKAISKKVTKVLNEKLNKYSDSGNSFANKICCCCSAHYQ